MKTSTDPSYCVRVTANDGALGDQHLRTFQDNEKTIPTILTTSQKLSTGVDARNEARQVILDAERIATSYLNRNPNEKKAHMMLLLLHREADAPDRAEPIIERLLNSNEFQLSDEERGGLSGELQKIWRQRQSRQRTADGPRGFTQVYCCANCGRLHNFVSMPCPHCDWSPQTIEELARSMMFSNSHFQVSALLILSREIANGKVADDVVPNLLVDVKTYLSNQKQIKGIEQVFYLLLKNERKNHRSISMARECSNCGDRILFSGAGMRKVRGDGELARSVTPSCCMDNLLWLLEQRVEPNSTDAFADLVCVLVDMTNNLLREQEVPSICDRQYSLQLLTDIGAICDLNKGVVIDTRNPRHLEIYFIRDSVREESEIFLDYSFSKSWSFSWRRWRTVLGTDTRVTILAAAGTP